MRNHNHLQIVLKIESPNRESTYNFLDLEKATRTTLQLLQDLVKRKRTPLSCRVGIRLLLHHSPRQLHQPLAQRLILRHRAPALRNGRRTDVLAALLRLRRREHRAHRALELILLEGLHAHAHRVPAQRIRLVDVLVAHLRRHEARVCRVDEDLGVRRRQVLGQVARVQDGGELGAAVLAVGAQVAVHLFERFELGVRGRGLVRVRGLVDDADSVARVGGFFEKRQEMARERGVAKVVDGHVAVDAVVGQLVGHDASSGVVDEDVEAVRRFGDFVGDLDRALPVREVELEPDHLLGRGFAELFRHHFFGPVDDFFGRGEDVDFGDAFAEESVRAAIALGYNGQHQYLHRYVEIGL